MRHRIVTVVLSVALVFAAALLIGGASRSRLPGDHQGFEPTQPIAFSHRLHAGELQIGCVYCHKDAQKGRHAGLPAASTCMNCHATIRDTWTVVRAEEEAAQKENREARQTISAELAKLYRDLALDEQGQPRADRPASPIPWVRIHDLPDFVYFDHRAHANSGVDCQQCHGAVETMERVRQVENLSMGWCVNCHRDANQLGVNGKAVHASLDCSTCHY